MRCEWLEENGLRFLSVDYRGGLTKDEMLALLEEQVTEVEAAGHGARVLILVDPNDRPHPDFLDAVKHAYRERMDPAGAKVAFVGVSGIGRSVVRGLQLMAGGLGALAFPGRDKALEYLAR
jgi:hypothetical protein